MTIYYLIDEDGIIVLTTTSFSEALNKCFDGRRMFAVDARKIK